VRRLDQPLGNLTLYAGQADIVANSDVISIAHWAEIHFGVDRCIGGQHDLLSARDDLHRTEEACRPAGGEQLLRIGAVPRGTRTGELDGQAPIKSAAPMPCDAPVITATFCSVPMMNLDVLGALLRLTPTN
jgi:hypothetical protein